MSPIYYGRLRPRPPRQESSEDDEEIFLTNTPLEPDKNEDTDGTEGDEDTEETMSAEEESDDGASPPAVESQVLDYDRPKRRRCSLGAFTSKEEAQ
jgi:hypothetical protein